MSIEILGLFLDILVLGFLGAMIFYSLRLSKSLSDFRAQRQDLDNMIIRLLSGIDQAERSIQNLKDVSAKETGELNKMIRHSKALSEELQIINEAAENMAKRLENLAEKNRKVVQGIDLSESPSARYKSALPAQQPKAEKKEPPMPADFPSFMIKDKEFPPVDELEDRLGTVASNDYPAPSRSDSSHKLQSQAERELYEALRGKNKSKGKP